MELVDKDFLTKWQGTIKKTWIFSMYSRIFLNLLFFKWNHLVRFVYPLLAIGVTATTFVAIHDLEIKNRSGNIFMTHISIWINATEYNGIWLVFAVVMLSISMFVSERCILLDDTEANKQIMFQASQIVLFVICALLLRTLVDIYITMATVNRKQKEQYFQMLNLMRTGVVLFNGVTSAISFFNRAAIQLLDISDSEKSRDYDLVEMEPLLNDVKLQ